MKHFDKILHFIIGVVIFIIVGIITKSIFLALILTTVIAATKEIRDLITGKGAPEWRDFHATFLGGLFGWLILHNFL